MTETTVAPPEKGILSVTKKALSLPEDYDVFDPEIIMHINSVFSDLTQLGVGPVDGFEISDDTTTWSDFLGAQQKLINSVKTYMYLRVKLVFDPPQMAFVLDSYKSEIAKLEWRLNVACDTDTIDDDTVVLSGGVP